MLLLEQEDEDPHHMFPLNLMRVRRWRRGEEFLSKCRSGVLQYVAYSSSMSFVNLVLELTGNFHVRRTIVAGSWVAFCPRCQQ